MKTLLIYTLFLTCILNDQEYKIRSENHLHDGEMVQEKTTILFTEDTIFFNDTTFLVRNTMHTAWKSEYTTRDYLFTYRRPRGLIEIHDMELNHVCTIFDITVQAKHR